MGKLQESMNSALNFGKMSSAAEAPWMAYLMDDSVFDTLNEFEQRLVDLRTEAAKTGDWQTLQRAVNELAKEAQTSGKDTAELQKAIEDTQRAAALGIKLSIELSGYEATIQKLQRIRYLQKSMTARLSLTANPTGVKSVIARILPRTRSFWRNWTVFTRRRRQVSAKNYRKPSSSCRRRKNISTSEVE